MKGYSTKYALTQGISIEDVEPGSNPAYVYTRRNRNQYVVGRTFFEDREAALANARAQAKRKAASLKKQLAKLEALAVTPLWSAPAREGR